MGPPDLQPRRDLTLTHATSLVVGITIGTGIFLKSAAMAQAVGTPALVLAAWVAAGVVAMLGALCFAELGALLPDAGGEYVYLRAAKRSEEHTSELQSQFHLVCRLLLEKKKKQ